MSREPPLPTVGSHWWPISHREEKGVPVTQQLDQDLDGIMADLAKLGDTPEGAVKREFLSQDLLRMAALGAEEATRPQAAAMAKAFSEQGDPLRKRIAQHWIDRAKATIDGAGAKSAAMPAQAAEQVRAAPRVHPNIEKLRGMARAKRPIGAAQ